MIFPGVWQDATADAATNVTNTTGLGQRGNTGFGACLPMWT